MNGHITVTIKYCGYYKKMALKAEESFVTERNIDTAMDSLKQYLKSEYDITPPFNVLVDGKHFLSVQKNKTMLNGGEVFVIMPHISGG